MSACEHRYAYAGVRYAHGANPRPGSGAVNRYYAYVYFCERCLDTRYEPISGEDDNSYNKPRYEATPGDAGKIVPEHDRKSRYW